MRRLLSGLLISLFFFCQPKDLTAQNEKDVHIAVLGQEVVERLPGSKSWVDRRVSFRVTNTKKKKLFVYGTRHENVLYPLRYVLEFDTSAKTWKPEKRVPWKKESSIYKDVQSLDPGESLSFEAGFSAFFDVSKRFVAVIYVSFQEGKEPVEIRSDEFVVK